MIHSRDRITTTQATVILINYILAAGILTLPNTAAQAVKTPDIWIAVLLGGIIAIAIGLVLAKLSQQYPGKTFFQFNQLLLGKLVGSLLSFIVVIYFISISAFEVRTLVEVTGFYLLDETPSWFIAMPFMWIGLYLITSGINSIARLFELVFPLTVIIFLLVVFMSAGLFELDNLRPVMGLGIKPVLNGIKTTTLSFLGVEVILVIVAFMTQPSQAVKVVFFGVGIPMIFYLITVVMVIGGLSIEVVVTKTWPTIDLIQSFEIKGLVFERFESFLLTIWIMQIFATYTITYYVAALGMAQIFNKDTKLMIFILLPVIYILSMIPHNLQDLFKFGEITGNIAIYLFGLIPLLLFIISRVKGG